MKTSNVSELIDTAGVVKAHYEYSPFGKLTYEMPDSVENPFKFSTKYLDEEVQLYYYGHRYYNPTAAKWLNRDHQWVWERGGYNLYGFIKNHSINSYDYIGLTESKSPEKKSTVELKDCCDSKGNVIGQYNPNTQCCVLGKILEKLTIVFNVKSMVGKDEKLMKRVELWMKTTNEVTMKCCVEVRWRFNSTLIPKGGKNKDGIYDSSPKDKLEIFDRFDDLNGDAIPVVIIDDFKFRTNPVTKKTTFTDARTLTRGEDSGIVLQPWSMPTSPAHELGHVIGLPHPKDYSYPWAIMHQGCDDEATDPSNKYCEKLRAKASSMMHKTTNE